MRRVACGHSSRRRAERRSASLRQLLVGVVLLHDGPHVVLLRGQDQVMGYGIGGFLIRRVRKGVLILQQRGDFAVGFVGFVFLAFDHVAAGCRADVFEDFLAVDMRLG